MYTEEKAMLSANVIDERPDFGRILECLQKESAYGQENAGMLKGLANSVKPMEERPMNKEVASKSPNCLVDYLWQEIHRWAIRMLHTVHLLAKTYHWPEQVILDMSPRRRRMYPQMIDGGG